MVRLVLFFIFLSFNLYAIDGTIIVLEAPLLHKPQEDAFVLQRVRKGEIIYIRKTDFETSPNEMKYLPTERSKDALRNFYRTLTKTGQDAYIEKKYVKVIFKDEREVENQLHKLGTDLTDYRLIEPLSNRHPFDIPEKKRASLGLIVGTPQEVNYNYSQDFANEGHSSRIGFFFAITQPVNFDEFDRIQFGGIIRYLYQSNSFTLESTLAETTETHHEINIGPIMSFDILKNKDYRLVFQTGPSVSFHSYAVTQDDLTFGGTDSNSFNGFSLSGYAGSYMHWIDVFNGPKVDFILGLDMKAQLGSSIKSADTFENIDLWETREISLSNNFTYSVSAGIQSYF